MVGGLGFEPRLAESESAVLPLDDPPPAADLRPPNAPGEAACSTVFWLWVASSERNFWENWLAGYARRLDVMINLPVSSHCVDRAHSEARSPDASPQSRSFERGYQAKMNAMSGCSMPICGNAWQHFPIWPITGCSGNGASLHGQLASSFPRLGETGILWHASVKLGQKPQLFERS